MKKIFYIVAAFAALAFTACSSEKDIDIETYGGKGLEFVHFAQSSDTWEVAAEDDSYTFDVVVGCTYAKDKDVTYELSIGEATTGVEGQDFTLAAKSVTIKAGEYLGSVPVTVNYEKMGVTFKIELDLAVDEALVNPTYGTSSIITVNSDKHPLAWLFGEYVSEPIVSYFEYDYQMDVTISSNPDDPNFETVLIKNLDPAMYDVSKEAFYVGKVDTETNTIIVADEYDSGVAYLSYGNFLLRGFDDPDPDEAGEDTVDIIINILDGGAAIELPNAIGSYLSEGGWWEIWYGGVTLERI